jgi:hypothetical protein
MLVAIKDGEIERSPDPVTTIEGDLAFFNDSPAPVFMWVIVHRAARTIVSTNPVTVLLPDAWSYAVGEDPAAEYPSVNTDAFGGKLQTDRASVSGEDLKFGRYFIDTDESQAKVEIGVVPAQHGLHFRYLCAVHTPGLWTTPTEEPPRYEAHARWAKLTAFAEPVA